MQTSNIIKLSCVIPCRDQASESLIMSPLKYLKSLFSAAAPNPPEINSKRDGDNLVLFVHGLGGNGLTTWGPMLQVMATDLEMQNYGYDCYSYPTAKVRMPFGQKMSGVRQISNGLMTHIAAHHSDKKSILIVAHSLGGIIVRQFVLDNLDSKNFDALRGLVFFAVPNTGSAVAKVGSSLSWNHKHLVQICNKSDLLQGLNSDWVRRNVERKLKTAHVIAAADEWVEEESSGCFIGSVIHTILGHNHSSVITPSDASDIRYKLLKVFILDAMPFEKGNNFKISGAQKTLPVADPLFDVYSIEAEHFYLTRDEDKALQAATINSNVWIGGASGVGKSAALKRLAIQSGWHLQQFMLASYQQATAISLLRGICDDLYERAGQPLTLVEKDADVSQILVHFKRALSLFDKSQVIAILIEEIPLPLGPEYDNFLEAMYFITLETSNHNNSLPKIIWLFSSIHMPEPTINGRPGKMQERVQFLKFCAWDNKDIQNLLTKIIDSANLIISTDEQEMIVNNASGNPRFVKLVLRELRNKFGKTKPLLELIQFAKARLG